MAEIIVTSTGDSGTGTLRQAISDANAGDVILFDPTVFPAGQTTAILLSSYLSVSKSLSIYGGEWDAETETYTSGATITRYVKRTINDVETEVVVNDDHPAAEGEVVLMHVTTRVALDGQATQDPNHTGDWDGWTGTRVLSVRLESGENPSVVLSGITFRNALSTTGELAPCAHISSAVEYRASLIDCAFIDCINVSGICAGVISRDQVRASISRCEFARLKSKTQGAAFESNNYSQNTFDGCTFDACTAANYGGAVYSISNSQNTFDGCTFDACTANYGGAVRSDSNSQNTFDGCTFDACTAANSGGAVRSDSNSQNTFDGCTFDACTANYGGAVYSISNSQNTFDENCLIKNCEAPTGSGVYDVTMRWTVVRESQLINSVYVADRTPDQQTVRYFTTTADSGEGSLRATISASQHNDIIQPDPDVFSKGSIIEIKLSSYLNFNKRLYLQGAGRRIVLDGQGACRVLYVSSTAFVSSDVDIINGYDVGNNGASIYFAGRPGVVFTRANIAGNYGVRLFYATDAAATRLVSCAVQNNVATTAILNATHALYNSTVAGNYVGGVAKEFPAANTREVNAINPTVYSDAGFVVPPPDALSVADWNADLWKSWDLRLTSQSPYKTGAEPLNEIDALVCGDYANYDIEGFPRRPYKNAETETPGGSLGAYEDRTGAKLVTTVADSGAGSLRQAIADAQDGDAIYFSVVCFPRGRTTTIPLSSTLTVNKSLAITGGKLEADGSYSSDARISRYVIRDVNGTPTEFTVDADNPAQEGETVLMHVATRVALDGQQSIHVMHAEVPTNGSITLAGLSFVRGAAGSNGGAGLRMHTGSSRNCETIVTDCAVLDCVRTNGGGGGVLVSTNYTDSLFTFTRCEINGCGVASSSDGGGFYSQSSAVSTLTDCSFVNNSASRIGGGIYASNTSQSTISNCAFANNSANSGGGFCSAGSSQNTINGCAFTNNSATSYGGGVFSTDTSQNTLNNCVFDGCVATTSGGGVYATNTSLNTLDGCAFNGNTATNSGGAVFTNLSTVNIFSDCEFNNCSGANGGAIYTQGHSINSFSSCEFTDCETNGNGGACVTIGGSQNTFSDCEFNNCSAAQGGAIRVYGGSTNDFYATKFDSCEANAGGGVYSTSSAYCRFDSLCEFVDCVALNGNGSGFYDESLRWSDVDLAQFINCSHFVLNPKETQTIRYFTTSADSGTGSLRQVLDDANHCDIVRPDPTIFPPGSIITIKLSSTKFLSKRVYLQGHGRRIVLDGQESYRIMTIGSSDYALIAEDVDFVNGRDVSSGAAVLVLSGTPSVTLTRTNYAGNYGVYVFRSSSAGVITFVSSVVQGNVGTSGLVSGVVVCAYNSTIAGNYTSGSPNTSGNIKLIGSVHSANYPALGFVTPPPDSLAEADWNCDLWKSWDLNLTAHSDYATGYEEPTGLDAIIAGDSVKCDYTGFPRQTNGACGALERRGNAKLVTNVNATGAGSLRQAISDAASGDEICFSFAVFPEGETTVINPGATIDNGNKVLTFNALPAKVSYTVTRDNVNVELDDPDDALDGETPVLKVAPRVALDGANSRRVFYASSKAVTIRGLEFRRGRSNASGAALLSDKGVTIECCAFVDNVGTDGSGQPNGAVYVGKATNSFNTCYFARNSSVYGGGALKIYGEGSTVSMTNCSFVDNATQQRATAISSNGVLSMTDCVFVGSTGSGPVVTQGSQTWTVSGTYTRCVFLDSDALFETKTTATFTDCEIPYCQVISGAEPSFVGGTFGTITVEASGATIESGANVATLTIDDDSSVSLADCSIGVLTVSDSDSSLAIANQATVTTFDVSNGGTITFDEDAVLYVQGTATIGTAMLTSETRGYYVSETPPDVSSATIHNVIVSGIGANVESVSGINFGDNYWITINSDDPTKPVLVEYQLDGDDQWLIADDAFAGTVFKTRFDEAVAFRVFDGESFFSVTVKSYGLYRATKERVEIGYVRATANAGYLKATSTAGYLQ